MSKRHNRFHISVLTKYKSTDAFPSRPPIAARPSAIMIDDKEHWEVDSILRHRNSGSRIQFLVHWKNYPIHESTWENIDKFKYAMRSIYEYEKNVLKSKLNLPTVRTRSTRTNATLNSNNSNH
jgi:hypothetical protein